MNRRHALSIAVATTLSITGIGAAIGATTNIFSAADASSLGKISPVSSTTLPPVVEHVRVDVDDPAPMPTAAPTSAPVQHPRRSTPRTDADPPSERERSHRAARSPRRPRRSSTSTKRAMVATRRNWTTDVPRRRHPARSSRIVAAGLAAGGMGAAVAAMAAAPTTVVRTVRRRDRRPSAGRRLRGPPSPDRDGDPGRRCCADLDHRVRRHRPFDDDTGRDGLDGLALRNVSRSTGRRGTGTEARAGPRHDHRAIVMQSTRFTAMGSDCHVVVVDGHRAPSMRRPARARRSSSDVGVGSFPIRSSTGSTSAPVGPCSSAPTPSPPSGPRAAWHVTGGAFDPTVLDCARARGLRPLVRRARGTVAVGRAEHRAAPTLRSFPGCGDIVFDDDRPHDHAAPRRAARPRRYRQGARGRHDRRPSSSAAGAGGAMVNLGGDLRTIGTPPAPQGWTIALHDRPASVTIAEGGVATSAMTRRRWTHDGSVRHHVIDAATGRCATTELVSASVIAPTAATAEVLATAALLAGPPRHRVPRRTGSLAGSRSHATEWSRRRSTSRRSPRDPEDLVVRRPSVRTRRVVALPASRSSSASLLAGRLRRQPGAAWQQDLHRFLGGLGVALPRSAPAGARSRPDGGLRPGRPRRSRWRRAWRPGRGDLGHRRGRPADRSSRSPRCSPGGIPRRVWRTIHCCELRGVDRGQRARARPPEPTRRSCGSSPSPAVR